MSCACWSWYGVDVNRSVPGAFKIPSSITKLDLTNLQVPISESGDKPRNGYFGVARDVYFLEMLLACPQLKDLSLSWMRLSAAVVLRDIVCMARANHLRALHSLRLDHLDRSAADVKLLKCAMNVNVARDLAHALPTLKSLHLTACTDLESVSLRQEILNWLHTENASRSTVKKLQIIIANR